MGALPSNWLTMRARVIALLVVAAVLLALAPDATAAAPPITVERFVVLVGGEPAEGVLAYPTGQQPSKLLVYGHGCCGRRAMERINDRLAFAATHGAAVVAMVYRGRGGWDVAAGAADLVAATEALKRRFPIRLTVAWGMSMGGEVTGMAVAARPSLFDFWVGTAGVYDLAEQWATPGFRTLIEAETGGMPASKADEYRRRSPVRLAEQMRALRGAVLVHGFGDATVLPGQSWRMADALRSAGVPVRLELVTSGNPLVPMLGTTWLAGHEGAVANRSAEIVAQLLEGRRVT